VSYTVINALAPVLTELIGGSADLTPSTKTQIKSSKDFQKNSRDGRYLRFGVREHAMGAIGNGISAYGALVPFTSTFFNFIEYMFPAVRLSAVSEHHHLYVMTHDSIGLGEDGPTHQPIEAMTLCRATPGVLALRPADGNETTGAYMVALNYRKGPTVLVLTRQNLPHLEHSKAESVALGAYVVLDADAPAASASSAASASPAEKKAQPDVIIIGTGSEVSIAIDATKKLAAATPPIRARVVSMPSWELFEKQPTSYRREVLTIGVPVVSVEALATTGWNRYAHYPIGMTTFGMSGPYEALYEHFGFTPTKIANHVTQFLSQFKSQCQQFNMNAVPALPVHFDTALPAVPVSHS